jgi:hypothetical protein
MAVTIASKQAFQPIQAADAPMPPCSTATRMVDRLESSGAWPSPHLIDSIAGQGRRALPALAAYVRGALMGHRLPEPLPIAIRLLGAIGHLDAIPVLTSLLRDCSGELADAAADALSEIGPEAAVACMNLAERTDLPLSNRVGAVNAAREGSCGRPNTEHAVGRRLHRMLLVELCRGELLSRPNRQWAAAVVESLAYIGFEPARPAIDAAFDRGIVSESELARSVIEDLFMGSPGEHRDSRLPFLIRYRRNVEMRSLRLSSLWRARAET